MQMTQQNVLPTPVFIHPTPNFKILNIDAAQASRLPLGQIGVEDFIRYSELSSWFGSSNKELKRFMLFPTLRDDFSSIFLLNSGFVFLSFPNVVKEISFPSHPEGSTIFPMKTGISCLVL